MRYLAGITFVSVMSLHISAVCFSPAPVCSISEEESTVELCQGEPVESAPFVSIDDRAMKAHIAKQGGNLTDQGQATAMAALIKQLGIETCQIDLAEPTMEFDDTSELYEHARKSVLLISAIYKCDRCDNWHATGATGFVISTDGVVVTNYHVVDQPEKSAALPGRENRFPAGRSPPIFRPSIEMPCRSKARSPEAFLRCLESLDPCSPRCPKGLPGPARTSVRFLPVSVDLP